VAEGGELGRDFDDLPHNTGTLEAGCASDMTELRFRGTSALSFQQFQPIATFSISREFQILKHVGVLVFPTFSISWKIQILKHVGVLVLVFARNESSRC
jgi:hypothetical protein